eukprot:scaffold175_cov414-Prasinococcus_capsulatus_cf.AAC.50
MAFALAEPRVEGEELQFRGLRGHVRPARRAPYGGPSQSAPRALSELESAHPLAPIARLKYCARRPPTAVPPAFAACTADRRRPCSRQGQECDD